MAFPLAQVEGSTYTTHRHEGQLSRHDDLVHAVEPRHHNKPRLDPSPQSPSLVATRDLTPHRPVYNDFTTAHSSITSGSINTHSKSESKQKSPRKQNRLVNQRAQPRRQVSKNNRQKKSELTKESLRLPTPARLSRYRALSEFDFNVSDVNLTLPCSPELDLSLSRSTKLDNKKPSPSSPLFNSLKNALRKKPSLASKRSQSPIFPSHAWVRDSIELANVPRKARQSPSDSQPPLKTSRRMQTQEDSDTLFDDPFTHKSSQDPKSRGVPVVATSKGHRGIQELRVNAERDQEHAAAIGLGFQKGVTSSRRQLEAGIFCRGGNAYTAERSSTREGSTVDNILKDYGSNHHLWDVSLSGGEVNCKGGNDDTSLCKIDAQSQLHDRFSNCAYDGKDEPRVDKDFRKRCPQHLHAGEIQKQKPPFKVMDPSGQAPNAALPHVPYLRDQRTLESSSDGTGQLSSYGDTKNLLNLTQRSQSVGPDNMAIFEDQTSQHFQRQAPIKVGLQDHNPYRRGVRKTHILNSLGDADSSPHSLMPKNESSDYVNTNDMGDKCRAPQIALERNVSHALRHASGVRSPSQEDTGRHKSDGGLQSSTDSSGFLGFTHKKEPAPYEAQKPNPKGFYHESAIHQTWLGSQRMGHVRIPVNHRGSLSSSVRFSMSASLAADGSNSINLGQHDEDANDWETLPGTGLASQAGTNPREMIGKGNQVGSSLANTSDEGEASPALYLHRDFSSTDRIVQHPAHIDYSLDYRQREIKGENFPVLLPCYQQHTVNGFPANSSRPLSPFQPSSSGFYYQQGPPLSTNHTNPFRYPPPESMGTSQSIDNAPQNGKRAANCSCQVPRRDRDILDRWINGFGAAQPESKTAKVSDPVEVDDSSRNFDSMAHANLQHHGGEVSHSSFSTLSPFMLGGGQKVRQTNIGIPGDAFASGHEMATREKTPDRKRSPGAFYQGLRSTTNPRPERLYTNRLANARHSNKQPSKYPTNQIRPLSLLRANPPLVGIEKAEGELERQAEDEFLYRSPLAPVKSRNWRTLYTKEQLSMIRSAAKGDGICDSESQQSQSSRPKLDGHLKANGSWKRLPWSPQMSAWPHDSSSTQTDLASRKTMISAIVLALCCLFPPVLVLYGLGYMDNIMLWITDGDICSFGRSHKRSALILVCFVVIVSLVAIPVAVVAKVPRQA